MRVTPALDNLEKVSKKSGVGKNTIRRIKIADDVNVSIDNVESIAKAFSLSLAEFVSPPGEAGGLSAAEIVLLQKFRELDDKDQSEASFFISSKLAFARMKKGLPPE